MQEPQALRILQDYRGDDGVINLDAFLSANGFIPFMGYARNFFYDNDETDFGMLIYVSDKAPLVACVKGSDESKYHELRSRSRYHKVILRYWPRELVDLEMADWDQIGEYCTAQTVQSGEFKLPVSALCRIVELATLHSSKPQS